MTSHMERFGLTRLSVSFLNMWEADKCLCLLKMKGVKNSVGIRAHSGTAIESGVTMGLLNLAAPIEDCQANALKEFDRLTALSSDPKREKERETVPEMVATALFELRQYGKPTHVQHRIEWTHPDVPLPFLGFADFYWEDMGVLVDLKTIQRMPSEISVSHARQVASYCMAMSDNLDGRVTYATPKKCTTYQVENMRDHVETLVEISRRIERFLSKWDSIEELCAAEVPNTSLFYYDAATRQATHEIIGL